MIEELISLKLFCNPSISSFIASGAGIGSKFVSNSCAMFLRVRMGTVMRLAKMKAMSTAMPTLNMNTMIDILWNIVTILLTVSNP